MVVSLRRFSSSVFSLSDGFSRKFLKDEKVIRMCWIIRCFCSVLSLVLFLSLGNGMLGLILALFPPHVLKSNIQLDDLHAPQLEQIEHLYI